MILYFLRKYIGCFLVFAFLFSSMDAIAGPEWRTAINGGDSGSFASSPYISCKNNWDSWSAGLSIPVTDIYVTTGNSGYLNFVCWATELYGGGEYLGNTVTVFYPGDCSAGTFDPETFLCKTTLSSKQKGQINSLACSYVGNPINFAVGNKYQVETDYSSGGSLPFTFSRTYNSLDGLWRDNYSTHLRKV